jgi:hypothetical protein
MCQPRLEFKCALCEAREKVEAWDNRHAAEPAQCTLDDYLYEKAQTAAQLRRSSEVYVTWFENVESNARTVAEYRLEDFPEVKQTEVDDFMREGAYQHMAGTIDCAQLWKMIADRTGKHRRVLEIWSSLDNDTRAKLVAAYRDACFQVIRGEIEAFNAHAERRVKHLEEMRTTLLAEQ